MPRRVSKSPRRLLRRAADALQELAEVRARHPEVAADLSSRLGVRGVSDQDAAGDLLRRMAENFESEKNR